MRTTARKTTVTIAATALLGGWGALSGGPAEASSPAPVARLGAGSQPSSCRPANHLAKITSAPASSGHRHYRVSLTAAAGYEPCVLAGSPTDVTFHRHGSPIGVTAGAYGPQHTPVTFAPGHPVHFDIQVPNDAVGAPADEADFTLRTPDGMIPGESAAYGTLSVGAGAAVGPVQPGA
ncbi:DUF4232 domain-containing protein [Streptomyces sp. NPDC005573]|uniref:DUF4232 domain-containing protein n=1 Tax=Streptomyces sp. NPDC005573 TaxID=3156890 RepID=UPI00339DBC4B